jgi:hypothetical protein
VTGYWLDECSSITGKCRDFFFVVNISIPVLGHKELPIYRIARALSSG